MSNNSDSTYCSELEVRRSQRERRKPDYYSPCSSDTIKVKLRRHTASRPHPNLTSSEKDLVIGKEKTNRETSVAQITDTLVNVNLIAEADLTEITQNSILSNISSKQNQPQQFTQTCSTLKITKTGNKGQFKLPNQIHNLCTNINSQNNEIAYNHTQIAETASSGQTEDNVGENNSEQSNYGDTIAKSATSNYIVQNNYDLATEFQMNESDCVQEQMATLKYYKRNKRKIKRPCKFPRQFYNKIQTNNTVSNPIQTAFIISNIQIRQEKKKDTEIQKDHSNFFCIHENPKMITTDIRSSNWTQDSHCSEINGVTNENINSSKLIAFDGNGNPIEIKIKQCEDDQKFKFEKKDEEYTKLEDSSAHTAPLNNQDYKPVQTSPKTVAAIKPQGRKRIYNNSQITILDWSNVENSDESKTNDIWTSSYSDFGNKSINKIELELQEAVQMMDTIRRNLLKHFQLLKQTLSQERSSQSLFSSQNTFKNDSDSKNKLSQSTLPVNLYVSSDEEKQNIAFLCETAAYYRSKYQREKMFYDSNTSASDIN